MDPWKVMPAPFGLINLGRESGKTEWQCVMILGVTHGKKYFLRTSAITYPCPWRDPCQWSEAEPARSVTRVGIRCIALFDLFNRRRDELFPVGRPSQLQ
jgi:hypothetical protein